MSILNLFSELDQERIRQGISKKDICYQADISVSTYSHWVAGHCEPRIYTVSKIMDVLGCDLVLKRKGD